jgi:hypothetical protein
VDVSGPRGGRGLGRGGLGQAERLVLLAGHAGVLRISRITGGGLDLA